MRVSWKRAVLNCRIKDNSTRGVSGSLGDDVGDRGQFFVPLCRSHPDAYVDRTVVCDPRENYLISRDARISDRADAYNLCRLLRLDELKEVYQAGEDHRAVFKASAQHYLRCRKQQIALKQKIKATVRCWGVLDVGGDRIYKRSGREDDLDRLSNPKVERQLPRPVPDAGHCSRYAVRPVTESLLGKHRRIRLVTEQIEGPGKPPVPNWSP